MAQIKETEEKIERLQLAIKKDKAVSKERQVKIDEQERLKRIAADNIKQIDSKKAQLERERLQQNEDVKDQRIIDRLSELNTIINTAAAAQHTAEFVRITAPLVQSAAEYVFPQAFHVDFVEPPDADLQNKQNVDPTPEPHIVPPKPDSPTVKPLPEPIGIDPPEPEPDSDPPEPDSDSDSGDDEEPKKPKKIKIGDKVLNRAQLGTVVNSFKKKYGEITTTKDNKRRSKFKGSRPLEDGEIHYKYANFMGPGTKEKYMDFEPLNLPDAVAQQHDKDFYKIDYEYKSKKITNEQRKMKIRKADLRMIDSLKKMGKLSDKEEESYRRAGLNGIQFKNILENYMPFIARKVLPDDIIGGKLSNESNEVSVLPSEAPKPKKYNYNIQSDLSNEVSSNEVSVDEAKIKQPKKIIKKPKKIKEQPKSVPLLSQLSTHLQELIMKKKADAKDDKSKKEFNKLIADISESYNNNKKFKSSQGSGQRRGELSNTMRYDEEKKRRRKRPITSSLNPHMDFPTVPTGRQLDKKLNKVPLDNFKNDAFGKTSGYRTLMRQFGNNDEVVQAQRRKKILSKNNEFVDEGLEKKKLNIHQNLQELKAQNPYGFTRIM